MPLAPARAQGGWRQWDVYLRDGTRLEANPLGALDATRLTLSVNGRVVSRSKIDYIAAQTTVGPSREPIPGASLPPAPRGRMCTDVVVHTNGSKTTGRVWFTRIRFSEGVITQRGVEIPLEGVAYIKLARGSKRWCKPEPADTLAKWNPAPASSPPASAWWSSASGRWSGVSVRAADWSRPTLTR